MTEVFVTWFLDTNDWCVMLLANRECIFSGKSWECDEFLSDSPKYNEVAQ